jgi:hypothetical protein
LVSLVDAGWPAFRIEGRIEQNFLVGKDSLVRADDPASGEGEFEPHVERRAP